MSKLKITLIVYGIMGLLAIFGGISVWVTKSYFEAQSFNAVTGKDVSTWQAMWIQLRVQEQSE